MCYFLRRKIAYNCLGQHLTSILEEDRQKFHNLGFLLVCKAIQSCLTLSFCLCTLAKACLRKLVLATSHKHQFLQIITLGLGRVLYYRL